MRSTRLAVALSAGALLALGACTGSDHHTPPSKSPTDTDITNGSTIPGMDVTAVAPADPIPGAKRGGTLTVLSADGLASMDPTEAYYLNTVSILSGLVTRSLTQYVFDQASGQMILVPDLATDLGQPS